MKPLGVAVIGLGVMGKTHIKGYAAAAAKGLSCRLIAVCSDSKDQLASGGAADSGNLSPIAGTERAFDPAAVITTTDPAEIAGNAAIDIVSICTPTDSHAELTIQMLRAGKHVLCEKPIAVHSSDVQRVTVAAGESGRVCMPAMCMRFWPGWDWLKDRVTDHSFGRALSATLTRVGSRPEWSRFYSDPARSGGAMFDLHVHDADVILYLFGTPRSVRSMGSIDHITTMYEYGEAGPRHVVAEGAWLTARGFPFRMRYTVEFEHAVADWDLSRTDRLLLVRDGKFEVIPLPDDSAYDREIAHFVQAIANRSSTRATLADAALVTSVLEAEKQSLESRRSAPVITA